MLDPRYFQEKLNELEKALAARHVDSALTTHLGELHRSRRELIQATEDLKAKKNVVSQEIAILKAKAKADPQISAQADAQVAAMRAVGEQIKKLDEDLRKTEGELEALALRIPNIPHASVPEGAGSADN